LQDDVPWWSRTNSVHTERRLQRENRCGRRDVRRVDFVQTGCVIQDCGKLLAEALFFRRRQTQACQCRDVSNFFDGNYHIRDIIAEGYGIRTCLSGMFQMVRVFTKQRPNRRARGVRADFVPRRGTHRRAKPRTRSRRDPPSRRGERESQRGARSCSLQTSPSYRQKQSLLPC